MTNPQAVSPAYIRDFRAEHSKLRERDIAEKLNISEAQLIAASCGEGVTRIDANPDVVMGVAQTLGEVMALTRNPSCVNEKVGVYDNYRSGPHASMILNDEIDLRIFPSHWCHAFMVEKETDTGVRRSLQVFDAAGDAVHKIFLRDSSDLDAWAQAKEALQLEDQSQTVDVSERKPDETPKADETKVDILRKEWARMTDTHQFMRLTSKLKMNRLGAYRIVGAPFVRALVPGAVDQMLQHVAASDLEVMVFTGNRGCIQIHSGPIETLKAMGPWQNVLDPRFNLHLRLDHIAEVWAVEKPTQRGPAVSVEAFNKDGGLIFQVFGVGKEGRDSRPAWGKLVEGLEGLKSEVPA
ncbi:ChuX/HutX family heme-like substrate-binding protein [uncultured Sulfitobacter sp.]|jgi:putative hemin transport protein|uniref:hemin-degrading factor n=1 Tax=uncultured Sulfitobacter sp. TaxID=191468 RepID=UPI0030D79ED3|tara:strand:+ start:20761 stop:21816 length:1056 start_codon:yes stop_codon:yes gene_type:complete